jgi:hypothetical protein
MNARRRKQPHDAVSCTRRARFCGRRVGSAWNTSVHYADKGGMWIQGATAHQLNLCNARPLILKGCGYPEFVT